MKIRRADWECENLGGEFLEIEFAAGEQGWDPAADRQLAAADYVLARLPVGDTPLLHQLEDQGFRFLATQCSMVIDLAPPPQRPAVAATICRQVHTREVASSLELNQILEQVDADMFHTDRISMDPSLPNDQAAKRHRDIVRGLFADRRNVSQGLYLRDEMIGFFQLQYRSDQHFFASLAGVFPPYQGSGLGVAAIWLPIQWALGQGVRRLTTSNSTNNPDSVRMHLAMGYRIERFDYVLRRLIPRVPK